MSLQPKILGILVFQKDGQNAQYNVDMEKKQPEQHVKTEKLVKKSTESGTVQEAQSI